MLARKKLGMITALCRSLHLSSRCGVSTAFAISPSPPPAAAAAAAAASSSTSTLRVLPALLQGNRLFAKSVSRSPTCSSPLSTADRQIGGSGNAPQRGMSSAAYGSRRGAGRGRGSGGPRPDYGPDRAGQHRANVSPGTAVEVVQKQHQRTGQLTSGTVSRLLTNSGFHPRGIKVMLSGGVVGRVQRIAGIGLAPTAAATTPTATHPSSAEPNTAMGYASSTSSSTSDSGEVVNGALTASAATAGMGRRRRSEGGAPNAATEALGARGADEGPPARPLRKFRAERVQGRSWSLEGGEVVARGEGGEELRGLGAAVDESAGFGGRRGRGRRGRGRR